MSTRPLQLLSAALLLGVACSKEPSATDGPRPRASASAKKAEASPSSAALASPEENYVAAAAKIACLGVELDSADAYDRERDKVLKAHAYTEETWLAASKQLGKPKADAVIGAMKCAP